MASGLFYDDDDGSDITMDVLSDAVDELPAPAEADPAWLLGANVRAVALLLLQSGDITPQGRRLLDATVRDHLPGVVWEDDER